VRALSHFIVEDEKSARRSLKRINPGISFPGITLYPLNEHSKPEDYAHYLDTAKSGTDMGLLSEAGCPCVADPGAQVVRIAQREGIRVVPLTGPSSIMLSLMASGFNGQSFTFHGYLPVEKNARAKKIAELERTAQMTGYTQIFIETPYRNNQLLAELIVAVRVTRFSASHPASPVRTNTSRHAKSLNGKRETPISTRFPRCF
jgi:16S rRNA (cytidine1402-2'-O)-methyltransferase